MSRDGLPWDELFELHVVRRIAQLFAQRWHMSLGYADATSGAVRPPGPVKHAPGQTLCQLVQDTAHGRGECEQTACSTLHQLSGTVGTKPPTARSFTVSCHVGANELAAPIIARGRIVGALLAGAVGILGTDAAPSTALTTLGARARELGVPADAFDRESKRMPWFDERELHFAKTLLEAAAEEIGLFLSPLRARRPRGQARPGKRENYREIIGESPAILEMFSVLDRVVRSNATVLIEGENGTGKELVARAIHRGSARNARPFVVTNCSAFNDNLLDSELFGYKKGAFTGAASDKQGLFEVADRGTFFLDEIGEMSPLLQVKVLRVLQEGTFIPVGDTRMKQVDVRIVAATNRDLTAMVAAGTFREDLYYRINVINLSIPPLRERREDIATLATHFLSKYATRTQRPVKTLTRACVSRLSRYDWPGNVRELENEIERLIVLAGDAESIDEPLLSPRMRGPIAAFSASLPSEPQPADTDAPPETSLPRALRNVEHRMIRDALKRHAGNKTRAAAELEISRRNLIRLVKKHELDGPL